MLFFRKRICIGDLAGDKVNWNIILWYNVRQYVQVNVIFVFKVPFFFFSVTGSWQCKDSLFEVDCSNSRASFYFIHFFFCFKFLSTNAWHSKWQDMSTTCKICSNEVEKVIKNARLKNSDGITILSSSTKTNHRNTERYWKRWYKWLRVSVLIKGSADMLWLYTLSSHHLQYWMICNNIYSIWTIQHILINAYSVSSYQIFVKDFFTV